MGTGRRKWWNSRPQAGEANFTVKIGDSGFSAEYLNFDGGVPNIKIIVIDWDRPQRQLMVDAPGTNNCYFHILSYVGDRIVPPDRRLWLAARKRS